MNVLAAEPRSIGRASPKMLAGLGLLAVALAVIAFLAGRAAPATFRDPIQTHDGVPVGVEHTPDGAVAAADDYVATEQATVERNPTRFAALVSENYVPLVRAGSLVGAGRDRLADRAGLRLWANGGESFTTVAAHRLDWYRRNAAQVTTWAGQIFWGPHQPPSQVWALGRTDVVWRDGRWEVRAMATLPIPAPAPAALPQAAPADETASHFYSRLAGFLPVSYGSPR